MKTLASLMLSALLLAPAGSAMAQETPSFVETLAEPALLAQLREGGFVLYMRHGYTDNARPDRAPAVDLADCATQRPLTEAGRALAAQVGKALRDAKLPLGEIYSSPLCRAKESAEAAFGPGFTVVEHLMYTANLTSEQKKPVLAATREILSRPVEAGKNRVIVAHAPNMADLIGYFVKPEGTVVVIRPRGAGQFDYIASIHPDMWERLLAP